VSSAHELRLSTLVEPVPPSEMPESGIPWNLAQGLRQRVAALPEAARVVLGVAAVGGRNVSRALLTAVVAYTEEDVLAALEAACRAQLLEEEGEHAYRFAHDVIREVVEADLGAARRTVLHREIAQALEQMPGEPSVEAMAYHYARAGEHDRAATWLERAGDR